MKRRGLEGVLSNVSGDLGRGREKMEISRPKHVTSEREGA